LLFSRRAPLRGATTRPQEDELIARIADLDALIVRGATKVTAKALAAAKKLKVIGVPGRCRHVNVEVATNGHRGHEHPGATPFRQRNRAFPPAGARAKKFRRPTLHGRGQVGQESFEGTELCGKTLGL